MRNLISELRRRNVFRVGVAYVVVAWLLAQVTELALDSFESPAWVVKTVLFLLALGFPLALVFAWAFELTPDGIKLEREVDRSQSIARRTGRRLDFVIIGVLSAAVALLLVDRFVFQRSASEPAPQEPAAETVVAPNDDRARSIAVLPFVDMSPAGDQEYFTDGLTENLLHALAQVRELKVAGRTSSFAFKNRNEDLRIIAQQLNVQNILEGSVQKAGDNLRITAQLVDANEGFHLWSKVFDRPMDDIFAIQDEIAEAVVAALRHTMLGEQDIVLTYHGDVEAYNAYLRGKHFARQDTEASWAQAIEQFERALAADPDMALAWAGMAETLAEQAGYVVSDQGFAEGFEKAREAALKALALDPRLPEIYLALSKIYLNYDWKWTEAEKALVKALSLRPGDSDIQAALSMVKLIMADFQGALDLVIQALAKDPLNTELLENKGYILWFMRRPEAALQAARQLAAMHPERRGAGLLLARCHLALGDHAAALQAAESESMLFAQFYARALIYQDLGDTEAAQRQTAELVGRFGDDVSWQLAGIYAVSGEVDKAFHALQRGYEVRDPGITYVQIDPGMDSLRNDPRFDAFLKKMGFR